jgi:hypothetical protein
MFDPTIHLGDVLTLASLGLVAWQRVNTTLRSVERFMDESRQDRLSLHQRLDLIELEIGLKRRLGDR